MVPASSKITPEVINTGKARVLSRFGAGARALLVVQAPDARVALVTAKLAEDECVECVFGAFFIAPHRLTELAAMITEARSALLLVPAPPA